MAVERVTIGQMKNVQSHYTPLPGANAMSLTAVNTTGLVFPMSIGPEVLPSFSESNEQAVLPQAGLLFSFNRVRYEKSVKPILTGCYAIWGGKLGGAAKQKSQQYHNSCRNAVLSGVSALLNLVNCLKSNGLAVSTPGYFSKTNLRGNLKFIGLLGLGISMPGFFIGCKTVALW